MATGTGIMATGVIGALVMGGSFQGCGKTAPNDYSARPQHAAARLAAQFTGARRDTTELPAYQPLWVAGAAPVSVRWRAHGRRQGGVHIVLRWRQTTFRCSYRKGCGHASVFAAERSGRVVLPASGAERRGVIRLGALAPQRVVGLQVELCRLGECWTIASRNVARDRSVSGG